MKLGAPITVPAGTWEEQSAWFNTYYEENDVIRFPWADSYAYYQYNRATDTLHHIPYADAWHVQDALIHGLTTNDVLAMLDAKARSAALLANRAKTPPANNPEAKGKTLSAEERTPQPPPAKETPRANTEKTLTLDNGEGHFTATIRTPRDQFELELMRHVMQLAATNWDGVAITAGSRHPDYVFEAGVSHVVARISSPTMDAPDFQMSAFETGWLSASIAINYNHPQVESAEDSGGIYAEPDTPDEDLPSRILVEFAVAELAAGQLVVIARVLPTVLTQGRGLTWWNRVPDSSATPAGYLTAPPFSLPEAAAQKLQVQRSRFILKFGPGHRTGNSITVCPSMSFARTLAAELIREKAHESNAAAKYGLYPDELPFYQTNDDDNALIIRWNATQEKRRNGLMVSITPHD